MPRRGELVYRQRHALWAGCLTHWWGEPDTGVDDGPGTVPLSERDPAPKPETKPGPVVKPAVDTVKATVVKIVVTYLSSIRLMRQPLGGFPMPATLNGSLCPWCLHCWGVLLIAAKAWA